VSITIVNPTVRGFIVLGGSESDISQFY